jgi:cytochrome c peroxidase
MDVGTGGAFQTPSLRGVGARGPWLHDGRAATLTDRFYPQVGGANHGSTAHLSNEDVRLLVGYLESL